MKSITQSCAESKTIKKAFRQYAAYKASIADLVQQVCEDPSIGQPLKAQGYEMVRHAKSAVLGPNFALYYTICDEARDETRWQRCPWCSAICCAEVEPGTIMLLNFGPHKITDRIK